MTTQRIYIWNPSGVPFASYAALVAGSTPIDGDVATVTMLGVSTRWCYDSNITAWRINDSFQTTSTVLNANTKLAGMQDGDAIVCQDTGQTAKWNEVTSAYIQ